MDVPRSIASVAMRNEGTLGRHHILISPTGPRALERAAVPSLLAKERCIITSFREVRASMKVLVVEAGEALSSHTRSPP